MKYYLMLALFCAGLTPAVWSQQETNPASSTEVAVEDQPEQKSEQEDEEVDELAEEQASDEFAEGEGTFSPTEKIKVDSAVSFPVGI